MPSCHFSMALVTRIITVCIGLLIIGATLFTLITKPFNLSNIIISVYYMIFMIILIFAEFDVLFILRRFRLVRYKLGKALFSIIIGLLMIQEQGLTVRGIGAGILAGLGIYHIITMFICKDSSSKQQVNTTQDSARTAANSPLQTV